MDVQTLERPMAKVKGRPKKPGGEGTPVRVDSDIVSKAKYLAARKGVALSDYLSDVLRGPVEKEFDKVGKDLMGGK